MPVIVALVLIWALWKVWWLLVALAVALVLGRGIGWWLARRDDHAAERRRREAELWARADQQHAWAMAGDDRGIYGDYPPSCWVSP